MCIMFVTVPNYIGQKRVSGHLRLDLQMAISDRNQILVLWKLSQYS